MDDSVRAAMAKWPNVPHCYGWLKLDQRGQWLLADDVVRHAGLIDFLGRNYDHDAQGNWFVQNGPQRVYVELGYTPWIIRLDGSGRLHTHTGLSVAALTAVWIDEAGRLIVACEHGAGLIDDRDLPALMESIVDVSNNPVSEEALLATMGGHASGLRITLAETSLPLNPLRSTAVASMLGFLGHPVQAT